MRWTTVTITLSLFLMIVDSNRVEGGDDATVSPIDRAGFDAEVRPQDDFYSYVNGGWMARTPIPADKRMVGMLDTMISQADEHLRDIVEEMAARQDHRPGSEEQLVGDFFRAYMDSDHIEELGTEPIRDLLEAVAAAPDVTELFTLGARLAREGVSGLLAVRVEGDFEDSTRLAATLEPSGLTLMGSAYYLAESEELKEVRAAFPRYVATLFELAGYEQATARGQAVAELETELAVLHEPAERLRDIGRYNPYPTEDLGQLASAIDWEAYLAAAGLGEEERIVVGSPTFVEGLDALLLDRPLGTWKDYWSFRVLDAHAELFPQSFVNARFDFLDRLSRGLEELPPRSARGTERITEDLEWPLARLYVERHFSAEARESLDRLIDNLIRAFAKAIDRGDWMSEETKARAQAKLANVKRRIGHPVIWPDVSELRISADDLVGNARRSRAFAYDGAIRRLSKPYDPDEDFSVPLWVTATYDLTANAIEFTAPLLQAPLFILGADDAYNYGTIGVVIGHELGHGFDDEGRKFDGEGNLADWWTDADAKGYEERADRLAAYYSAFEPLEGLSIDGRRTLGENISDLTGVVIAYDAYVASLGGEEPPVIDGFTGRQRYFLSYAQVWRNKLREEALRQWIVSRPMSPPRVRVNGPLKHCSEFYEAFDVKPGDGMWLPPEERVAIW